MKPKPNPNPSWRWSDLHNLLPIFFEKLSMLLLRLPPLPIHTHTFIFSFFVILIKFYPYRILSSLLRSPKKFAYHICIIFSILWLDTIYKADEVSSNIFYLVRFVKALQSLRGPVFFVFSLHWKCDLYPPDEFKISRQRRVNLEILLPSVEMINCYYHQYSDYAAFVPIYSLNVKLVIYWYLYFSCWQPTGWPILQHLLPLATLDLWPATPSECPI